MLTLSNTALEQALLLLVLSGIAVVNNFTQDICNQPEAGWLNCATHIRIGPHLFRIARFETNQAFSAFPAPWLLKISVTYHVLNSLAALRGATTRM